MAHFICLVDPSDFEEAVDEILGGESIDFRTTDRLQFAMRVVDHIERLLPLPDFETWAQDFSAFPEAYRLYTHYAPPGGPAPVGHARALAPVTGPALKDSAIQAGSRAPSRAGM